MRVIDPDADGLWLRVAHVFPPAMVQSGIASDAFRKTSDRYGPSSSREYEGSGRKLLSFRRSYGILIDVEAKARAFRQRDISIDRLERIRTQALAELLERQEIFGDDEIRHAGRRVHGGG